MADITNGHKPKYPVAQNAAEILAIDDLQGSVCDVDEWKRSFILRPLTQQETESIMKQATTPDPDTGKPNTDLIRANRLALAASITSPQFTIEEIDALCNQHSAAGVSQLIAAHLELNRWDRLFGGGTANGKVGEGNADAAFPVESDQETRI